MIDTPQTKNSLFTREERNEFISQESRLIEYARKGQIEPLLKLWHDKRALVVQRATRRED